MFSIILISAATLMQVYVFWRAASLPLAMRRVSPKRWIGAGVTLWLAFLLSRLLPAEYSGTFATTIELCSLTWLVILFLTSTALLAVDTITGFGLFMKRLRPRLLAAAFVAGGVLSLIALVQGLRPPVVQEFEVRLAGLPVALDGTAIVVVSDLHLGAVLDDRWLAARVEQVQALRPDAVMLLGDVFEGHSVPGKEMLAALRRLSAPLGVWAVLGNHEFHRSGVDNTAQFTEAGVRLLQNAWVELRPGLVLAGVDDLSAANDVSKVEATLAKALAGHPSGATILLSHAPLPPDSIVGKGVDLMLSGHTHGGQVWPFGYLVGQRFPLFEGRYELRGTTVIVSRGTGTWGPRMRLWRPGEILRVTLHTA